MYTCKRFMNDNEALDWASSREMYIVNRVKSKRGGYLYNFKRKYNLFKEVS